MTSQEPAITTAPHYRFAGSAAITSGVIGFFAYVALMTGVFSRLSGGEERFWTLLFRSHDAGAILQALLMIPVVLTLHHIATRKSSGVGGATVAAGVIALSLMILLMLLGFAGVIADTLYMVPQGVLGVWLIAVGRLVPGVVPRGLRRLGFVSGIGLVLVATFPIAYAVLVDPVILRIPVPQPFPDGPDSPANGIIHLVLMLGSFMGVLTFPIWSALIGRRLLRGPALK
jgi:hypothetical protein